MSSSDQGTAPDHPRSRRTQAWVALGLTVVMACGGGSEPGGGGGAVAAPPIVPTLPASDDAFVLGAAGAPQPLFGDASSPTFEAAYASLAADGFNRFVPVFLTSEAGGGTAHLDYYLPPLPELFVTPMRSCSGPNSAWRLPDGLSIDFPVYLLIPDQPVDAPLDLGVATSRLQAFITDCLAGDTTPLSAGYLQDEPANAYIASVYDNAPGEYDLGNVHSLAQLSRDLLARPTLMIEAPLPFMLPFLGAAASDVQPLSNAFWDAVDEVAPAADEFGFDVYPIDLIDDLTVIRDYVRAGLERAPSAKPVMVLQGSGYADTGIPIGEEGRRPSRRETRAMAFLAVAEGAAGIYWYGQSATFLGDGPLWDDIREVARDLRRLSGVLALEPLDWASDNPAVALRATRADDTTWVLVANASPSPQSIVLPIEGAGRLYDGLSGEVVLDETPSEALSLYLEGHDARLLALQHAP